VRNDEERLPDRLAFVNVEAEQSVLGAALQDHKALKRMREMDMNAFTQPEHRVLFASMVEADDRRIDVDLVTMHTMLSEQSKLDLIGGDMYLMQLINFVPSTANVGSYIRIVNECATRRQMKAIGEELIRKAGFLDEELDAIREGAALRIRDVKAGGGVKLISQEEAVMMTYDKMEKAQKREGQTNDRIMTGIRPLDKMTGGLSGSKLMIIGARPSVGKSIFAMTICMNAAKQGKRVLYISLEMEADELMEREFAAASLVPLTEITSDEISIDGWKKMAEAFPDLASKPIFYCTDIHFVEDVRKAAFQLFENGGLDLICVDYIQLLKTTQKRNSRQEEVADISRGLKWLAQELKIPVIALSQLNRASQKEKRPPTMAEARESGAIEQDANIFLLLHDPDTTELKNEDLRRLSSNLEKQSMKLIYVNVDKNRQGKKGVFYIAFDGDHMRFLPLSKENPP
jgi:replicative DNA helicase